MNKILSVGPKNKRPMHDFVTSFVGTDIQRAVLL